MKPNSRKYAPVKPEPVEETTTEEPTKEQSVKEDAVEDKLKNGDASPIDEKSEGNNKYIWSI